MTKECERLSGDAETMEALSRTPATGSSNRPSTRRVVDLRAESSFERMMEKLRTMSSKEIANIMVEALDKHLADPSNSNPDTYQGVSIFPEEAKRFADAINLPTEEDDTEEEETHPYRILGRRWSAHTSMSSTRNRNRRMRDE